MVFRKLEIEFGSVLKNLSALPYPARFFIVQALQLFAGTPPNLREKYYRLEHRAFEIGVGDIGRLLVDVDEKEQILDFMNF